MAERLGAAVLELKTDDRKLTKGLKRAKGETQKLGRDLTKTGREATRLARTFERAGRRMRTAFRAVGARMTSFTRGIGRAVKGIFSMRGAVVALAGAAALGLLVKRSLAAADSIAKTADTMKITTDALQEYRFAAGLAGVETATLDKSFQVFTRNIGELGRSSSELQTALQDLAPALLEDLRATTNVTDALRISFKALGEVESATTRLAIAQTLFSRGGRVMVNMIREGAVQLEAMRKRARDLGLVIAEDLLRNAEGAVDALSELAQVLSVTVKVAVLEHAADIQRLAAAFTRFIPRVKEAAIALALWAGLIEQTPVERLAAINRELASLREETTAILEKGRDLGPLFALPEGDVAVLQRVVALLNESRQIRAGIRDDARVAARQFQPEKIDFEDVGELIDVDQLNKATAAFGSLAVVQDNFFSRQVAARRRIEEFNASLEVQAEILKRKILTPQQRYNELIEQYTVLLKAGKITQVEFNEAQKQAAEALREMTEAVEDTEDAVDTLGDEVESVMDRMIGDLRAGELSWESFADVALSAIRSIAESFTSSLGEQAGGFLGDILGAAVGAFIGGGGTVNPDPGNITLLGKQAGGPVRARQLVVVGEGGTEVFQPDVAGKIIPNDALGGITVNQNFDFRGAEPGVFSRAHIFAKQIKEETIEEMAELMDAGGTMAQISGRRRQRA